MKNLETSLGASTEHANKEHRFGFLGRRTGEMATASSLEAISDDEAIIFGLEPELQTYMDLWTDQTKFVSAFLEDPENSQLLRNAIIEQVDMPDDRDSRREVAKLQERDFAPLTAIFITGGRIEAYIQEKGTYQGSIRGMAQYVKDIREQRNRADSKRAALFAPMLPTKSGLELKSNLEDLFNQAKKKYTPVIRQELKTLNIIDKNITDNYVVAEKLVDTFLGYGSSESGIERCFVTILANNHWLEKDNSVLAKAVEILESATAEGRFTDQFLEDQLQSNDGDNLLAFFAEHFNLEDRQTFLNQMAQTRETWPTDLQKSYDEFAKAKISTYKNKVNSQSERSVLRTWLPPDLTSYEDAIERQFKRLYGNSARLNHVAPKQKGGSADRRRSTPTEALAFESAEKEQKQLEVVSLVRTQQGLKTENGGNVETILDRILNGRHGNTFRADILRVIEHLRTKPFETGVRSLQHIGTIFVDGKGKKIYRASPARISGLSVSNQVKDARVIFTVSNGHLAILAIPTSHDEYEQFIKSF